MTRLDLPAPLGAAPADAPPQHFKEALARLAGGLAIVACWQDGRPQGLLVSSITGLSVDPPRYLFCVRREAGAYEALVGARLCGVSILSTEDEAEAQTFIDPGLRASRFTGPGWKLDPAHPPLLDSGLSAAVCRIEQVIDAGSHAILLAAAESLRVTERDPLVAYNRGLRRLEPDVDQD